MRIILALIAIAQSLIIGGYITYIHVSQWNAVSKEWDNLYIHDNYRTGLWV